VRRRQCVAGGAPVNFGQRRRAAGPKKSAAAKIFFTKIPEQISFYRFRMTFFSHRKWKIATAKLQHCKFATAKTQQHWHLRCGDKLSAATARRSIKVGGAGAHKLSSAAARRGATSARL